MQKESGGWCVEIPSSSPRCFMPLTPCRVNHQVCFLRCVTFPKISRLMYSLPPKNPSCRSTVPPRIQSVRIHAGFLYSVVEFFFQVWCLILGRTDDDKKIALYFTHFQFDHVTMQVRGEKEFHGYSKIRLNPPFAARSEPPSTISDPSAPGTSTRLVYAAMTKWMTS